MNAAARWAEFARDLTFDDLPADVVRRMKRSLLDSLGAMITGAQLDSLRIVTSYVEAQAAKAEATVLPGGVRTTAANAAMVNAASVQSSELWEVHVRARMQVGCLIPPTALALAEKQGSTGRDLITAMAAGSEVSFRVSLATRVDPASPTFALKPSTDPAAGYFLSGATYGVYGVATTAAKLLGLGPDGVKHAITTGPSITPVIGLETGGEQAGMPKDLYQGFAAGLGVTAAELAARGFTGRDDVTGHLAVLDPDYSPELLTRGLGSEWLACSGGLFFKYHAGGGMVLPSIAALARLLPVDADAVEGVDVYVSHLGVARCANPDPPNPVAARSSIPFILSAMLTFPDEVRTDPHLTGFYTEEKLSHPARAALAHRIHVLGSDDYERGFEAEWPLRFPAHVAVHDRSGATRAAEVDIASPEWTDDQVSGKFADLAGRVLPPDQVDQAIDEVWNLDRRPDVHALVRALTAHA